MTELDVYKLEHLCIADLMLSDCTDLSAEWKTALLGYINGVNTMAAMVLDKLKEDKYRALWEIQELLGTNKSSLVQKDGDGDG